MTNEIKTQKIKAIIENLTVNFGGFENVAYLEHAYHACNPYDLNQWKCRAVKIEGKIVETGFVSWHHEEESEDAADYDWNSDMDFAGDNTYDLDDEDDLTDVYTELSSRVEL